MATHRQLQFDYSFLCKECYECWTSQDLQLAAELGKTLLERNKELENGLKKQQNVIDDKTQEIEYLTKQITALREVNDSRLRIYEQLEVSIQELERANQRLALDNSADKKHIKSLCTNIDSLEARGEELQKTIDDMTLKLRTLEREKQRRESLIKHQQESVSESESETVQQQVQQLKCQTTNKTTINANDDDSYEEITKLLVQIQQLKSQKSRDQRKIQDLEEQLSSMIEEMAILEEKVESLQQKEEDVKSLQEEISALEEVRQGHLCGRCLGLVDSQPIPQDVNFLLGPEEESSPNTFRNSIHFEIKDPEDVIENPYRTLVEKYEALVEAQAKNRQSRDFSKSIDNNCLSLQEELQLSGDFNSFQKDIDDYDEEERKRHMNGKLKTGKHRQAFSATPTDFSEAETSSSGYSDETSNKGTQTERTLIVPGSFLCSIADGDDCKFSIYDDACPVESRFRKTPEYRTLFREIFAVLKRAAEAKDDGEKLPLLEDVTPLTEVPKVPPVTPAQEQLPVDFDDLQSLPESSVISETASETSTVPDPILDQTLKTLDSICDLDETIKEEPQNVRVEKDPRQTNDLLEYMSLNVGIKKKKKTKHHNRSPARRLTVNEALEKLESPSGSSTPRSSSGKRRKEWRNYDSSRNSSRTQSPAVQPHVLTTLSRRDVVSYPTGQTLTSPSAHERKTAWDYQPFVSTAAQEVARLKRLEKSYAEVLKFSPRSKSYYPSQRK